MTCPKCQQQDLKSKYINPVNLTVDYCPRCKGIWFDGGELKQAMPEADQKLQTPKEAVRLQALCPACRKPLYAFHYPRTQVTIEACKKCGGVWLDAGEFAVIRKARLQRKEEPSPKEPAELDGVKGALIELIDDAIDWFLY